MAKSFAVLVEAVVKPAEVITRQKPFFYPGASTSNMAENAEPSGPGLVQAPGAGPDVLLSGTGDAALSVDQTLPVVQLSRAPVGLRVKMISTVRPAPRWKATSGTAPQTETSPGTSLQIKNSLRRPAIERQSEA